MNNELWTAYPASQNLRAFALEVAVHASSLWDGFVFQRNSDDLFQVWGNGGIELHFRMAELAIADAKLDDALFAASDSSFPGMYTYEVTEALGQMVASHLVSTGGFPTEQEWQTALGELALGFFERGRFSVQEMTALREVVAQQLPPCQSSLADSPTGYASFIPIKPPPVGGNFQATA